MADEDDKTTIEGAEKANDVETKKGLSKGLIFGGLGALFLIVGVALALFVIKPMMSSSGGDHETDQTEASDDSGHSSKKKETKQGGHGSEGGSFLYAIKDIIVNPAGTGGSRFLSVSFGFELESSQLEQLIERRELQVRDALITIMSSKTVAQLTDVRQKEIARYQIKKRLEKMLGTEELTAVYFTDFVLQ
jgi:flagellar FliL protein